MDQAEDRPWNLEEGKMQGSGEELEAHRPEEASLVEVAASEAGA